MRISDWSSDVCSSDLTLDRFCGGGISSVNFAAASVMSGMEDCVIAGGTEMMSYTAQVGGEEAHAGIKPLGMGAGHEALAALHPQSHQGLCGDAIATIAGNSRSDDGSGGNRSVSKCRYRVSPSHKKKKKNK